MGLWFERFYYDLHKIYKWPFFENQLRLCGQEHTFYITAFLAFKVPHAKTYYYNSFSHVKKCSMFVQELLENKIRATSDVIGLFCGWLVFHPNLLQKFRTKRALKTSKSC